MEVVTSEELEGTTLGLKPAQIRAVERLYRRRVPIGALMTAELCDQLVAISAESGRQVGVILDRKGHVLHVVAGDAHKLMLPELGRQRAGHGRLRGVRLIHTHVQGEALTRDDLTDLSLLRLDLVCAIAVLPNGRCGDVYCAHLARDRRRQAGGREPPSDAARGGSRHL